MTHRSFRSSAPLAAILLGVAVLLACARPVTAATPAQVDAALARAKANLYSKMQPGQFWEETPAMDEKAGNHDVKGRQWGGYSALAVYALLSAGENPASEKFQPAVDWIKKQRIVGNYALGIRAQIWPFLAQNKETQALAIQDRDYLYRGIHRNPNAKKGDIDRLGFYPYWFNDRPKPGNQMGPGDSWWDLSVSQYGVLGMWACEQVEGVVVPVDYWAEVDKAWKNAQFREGPDQGGWAYQRGGKNAASEKVKATMTAAGVATLFITQDYLLQYQAGGFSVCRGGANNVWIEDGLAWMDKNIKSLLGGGQFYGMYGVERIGVASGRKYFGDVDWYEVGADYLVRAQAKDGSWGGSIPNTCFAMLFLSRGRSPVIMNKLEYAAVDPETKQPARLPWAQRPRDVANFAKEVGKNSERYFNWQVVNLKVAPDDLNDAPILYVSGSKPLAFTPAEVDTLRKFVEAGGMVLFNADCGDPAFVQSIVGGDGLAAKLFPRYEFRELPTTHSIYTDQIYLAKNWKDKPKVLGLSNGVRELLIVVPDADVGRAWQTHAQKSKPEAFELGANLFYYATEKGSTRYRGDTHLVKVDPKIQPTAKLRLARLMVGDNPDPEPGGWRRMVGVMQRDARVGLTVEPINPGEGKLLYAAAGAPAGFQAAHLTGTAAFKLSPAAQEEIRTFVGAGGTLIVDAAGGSAAFLASADKELVAIFGGDVSSVGAVIVADEPVYTWPGFRLNRVDFRRYAQTKLLGNKNVPRVRAIERGGKIRVFYSREDLSFGLVGQPCDGVLGYDAATATDIMRNILLYATYGGKTPPRPTTAPTTAPIK